MLRSFLLVCGKTEGIPPSRQAVTPPFNKGGMCESAATKSPFEKSVSNMVEGYEKPPFEKGRGTAEGGGGINKL